MNKNSILISLGFILLVLFISLFPSGIFRVITLLFIIGYLLLILFPHFSRIHFAKLKNRIYEKKLQENAEVQMKEIRETPTRKKFVIPDVDEYSHHQVQLHLTRRITEHLKKYYPSAHWGFTDAVPLKDMLGGVPFRIRIYEVGSWNYADVLFGTHADIEITLLKLASLSDALEEEAQPYPMGDTISWLEQYGMKMMMEFYAESVARGWDSFFIDTTGKAFCIEDGKEQPIGHLDQFPQESDWELLSSCLKKDNIDCMPMQGMVKIIVKI